jgi:hypothetical protein
MTKEDLIADLDSLFNELVDYRFRLLSHLNSPDVDKELTPEVIESINQVRSSLSYVEDRISEIKAKTLQRVYCIEVTTEIEQRIKVLARCEDDAIKEACDVAERRIRLEFKDYDIEYSDSSAWSVGDESEQDDEADFEVHYDD